MNNYLVGCVSTLIEKMNTAEQKEVYRILNKINPNLAYDEAFNTIKGANKIYGGFFQVKKFTPIGIEIAGWFLPRVNYDKIEFFCGKYYLGEAQLNLQRIDVYNRFPFFNDKNTGFQVFIQKHLKEMKKERQL